MINVVREPDVPTSLTSAAIQSYIDALALHLDDPAANPKPTKPPSYRSSDLLHAFDRCFYCKCYLTEQKFINSWPMDVEHFISKDAQPELRYEWSNLFPADHGANMIKPRVDPPGGYLDPCNPTDDVETEILYSLEVYGGSPYFEPRDGTNAKAVNTCNLLDRVHNGHDANTRMSTATLRHAIHKKYVDILHKILEWQAYAEGSQLKFQAKRELKDMLSRKSAFTMLCRSTAAVQTLPDDFFD